MKFDNKLLGRIKKFLLLAWKYLYNVGVSFDRFINTLIGGLYHDSISERMGKRILEGKATRLELALCRLLSRIDPFTDRHCVDSIGDLQDE